MRFLAFLAVNSSTKHSSKEPRTLTLKVVSDQINEKEKIEKES
jgi:hypothetical protein